MSSSDEELDDVPLAVPLDLAPPDKSSVQEQQAYACPDGEDNPAVPAPPVPVTLITGYLGAGKTSLVNYVLTSKHGYRCAVLLNEIADSADIERALVKEPEGAEASPLAEWRELENGCICCSAKNDMVKALEALMQQRSRFDYVLIETTGLANPGPVAAALWTDDQLESSVCLDCVVTVVDARHIERQLADPRPQGAVNEAQQQVAFADVVLLNKTDLASDDQLQRIEDSIRGMNGEVSMLRCQHCKIDLARILNTGIYSAAMRGLEVAAEQPCGGSVKAADAVLQNALLSEPQQAAAPAEQRGHQGCGDLQCGDPSHHHHHHQHYHSASQHDSRVGTVTLLLQETAVDLPRLRHWLDTLLWEQEHEEEVGDGGGMRATAASADIFRIKGLLHAAGSNRKHILQGVHEIYDVVEGPEWKPEEARYSKVVMIGRCLRQQVLQAGLQACAASQL